MSSNDIGHGNVFIMEMVGREKNMEMMIMVLMMLLVMFLMMMKRRRRRRKRMVMTQCHGT